LRYVSEIAVFRFCLSLLPPIPRKLTDFRD
jgi:hypothetical protein